MASARAVPPKRTAGYEPAKGFPDPNFVREPEPPPAEGVITHLPRANGPACGAPPNPSAAAYSPTDPTCPWCANYLEETKKTTARMFGPPAPTAPPPATTPDLPKK